MYARLIAFVQKYERHLSALAMVAGFVVDNFVFDRVDLAQTQQLLLGYLTACFVAIPLYHALEMRHEQGARVTRMRLFLPLVSQFALGGFWSAFVIFYGRSAVFGASWPFLLFLFLLLLGSEYFNQYHARLVFTSVLLFVALYLLAIFMVPVYVGSIGVGTFLLSGAVAIGLFALFTILLRLVARRRFYADVWRIRAGAFAVVVAINLFYFTNVLPPLPLAARAAGIYHSVWRVPGNYYAQEEPQSWLVRYLDVTPTVRVVEGESVYAYTSIFAPTKLETNVVYRWQWFHPAQKKWVARGEVAYSIIGGRENGYRGYAKVRIDKPGRWRALVETEDGRTIESLPFIVELVTQRPLTETVILP